MSHLKSQKYSGHSWIGDIPTHWSLNKFRHIFTESSEINGQNPVGEMLSVSGYRGVEIKKYDDENRKRTLDQIENYRVVRKGQLAVNTMWLNHSGLGVSDLEGHVSPAYRAYWIRPDVDGRFIHHLMRSSVYVSGYTGLLTGVRPNSLQMSRDNLMSFPIIFPPLSEQRAISSFLDHETKEIDDFIKDQEELIALLNERRAATITQAVTKGLEPNAPMKDSGARHLGEVPASWTIGRIKDSVLAAKNGTWGADPDGSDNDIRCVRVADFDRPSLSIHDNNATLRSVSASDRNGRVLQRGDLLLEKSGGGEKSPVGFVVLYDRDEPAVCSNFVSRVSLKNDQESRFWTYVHSANYSVRLTQKSIKQATGIQNLDQSAYFNEVAVLPPYAEQQMIADYLDHETSEIDAAIADAKEAIELSKERRAALISAAVTGKIDVRNHTSSGGTE